MDNIARDAMLARQAGLSYGKLKALQPVVKVEKNKIPEGWKLCERCGKPFDGGSRKNRKFCDDYCRREAYYEKSKREIN